MIGYIVHLMGDQTKARRHIERMLGEYEVPVIGAEIIRFVFDQRATAQCFLARILWLQGYADQAAELTKEIVAAALAGKDGLSLCQVLVQGACPVALFTGDLEALDRHVTMLLDYSERQALDFWQAFGRCFRGVLIIRRGRRYPKGLAMLGAALDELREIQFGVYYGVFLSEYADALSRVGRSADAHRAIDEALERSARNEERWYLAELLRIKGEILLDKEEPMQREAERLFLEALDRSRQQETAAWELRAATSLARLYRQEGRIEEAREALAAVYTRFDEGFDTADLKEARDVLASLPS